LSFGEFSLSDQKSIAALARMNSGIARVMIIHFVFLHARCSIHRNSCLRFVGVHCSGTLRWRMDQVHRIRIERQLQTISRVERTLGAATKPRDSVGRVQLGWNVRIVARGA
jgi:hypothetical protein